MNEQTYKNIELLVYDDCSDIPVDEALIEKYITRFPYILIRGIQNNGSNIAFEKLTQIAKGEFFAYCDQDDIWEKEKIALMVEKFNHREIMLVCSDLSVIDGDGHKIANSITEIRKRYKFKSGYNLANSLLISNFVTGCAMMVRKDIAKKAIPFETRLFHDNWIAVIAALNGKIEFIDKSLVRYRQHSSNQTGILKGIIDKKTYYEIKIQKVLERYKSLQQRLNYNDELNKLINYCLISIKARKSYFLSPSISSLKTMLEYSEYYKLSILIEIFLPIMPEFLFKYIIKLTQKGVL